MGNKDEKTFTDLFSSAKEETEIETQTQRFSNIDSSIDKEEDLSATLTFDNLFGQITSNGGIKESNKNELKGALNELNFSDSNIYTNENTFNQSIEESNPLFEETHLNDNHFFKVENAQEDNEFSTSDNGIDLNINPFMNTNDSQQENNIDVSEDISNQSIIETNPLFEETHLNNNQFFKIDNAQENNDFSTSDNDIDLNTNPFMNTNDSQQEKNIDAAENTLNESIIESNPLFEETHLNDNPFFKVENIQQKNNLSTSDNDIDLNINPFINSNASQHENNMDTGENISNEPIVEINSLFGNQEKKEEQNIENNPFFTNESSQPSILLDTTKKVIEPEVDNQVKSISPFFEEEKKSEDNPFFQNQLNLIENKSLDNHKGTIDTTKSKHYNVKIVKKKEPLIKLVLGVLSYALFIWLLLIGVTLLVYVLDIKIRAAKGDYSSPTFNAYVVLTGSMLPEIQVYDVVVTKKVDAQKLKEGDVITFASTDTRFLDTIITHRIIKKNPPSDTEGYTFQTKGDNNNVADSALVPDDRIFGKVILKIPKLGYLQEFLATRGGWIIVILIPCLTVISYDTVKLIKGLKRKKYKNIKVQK